jgi:hypothetical protein
MELSIGIMFAKAKLAAETFQLINSFIVDEAATVLSTMGDGELRAALSATSDTTRSDKPEREIAIVIGHLQSAREAFRSAARSEGQRLLFRRAKFREAKHKEISCLLLIMMCYAYLKSRSLIEHYASELRDLYVEHCENLYSDGPAEPWLNENVKEMDSGEETLLSLCQSLELPLWKPKGWTARLRKEWQDARDAESEPRDDLYHWREAYY